tara:strand:- start:197 stop:385 length:189 start_codon:yes stop_codon:yes gene_type:complete
MKIYEVTSGPPPGHPEYNKQAKVKKPVIYTKPKATQDFTSRAPVKLSPSITSKNYKNAMGRS